MPRIIGNIMEWTKWDLDKILDSPFIPLLTVINTVTERQAKQEEAITSEEFVDLSSPEFLQYALSQEES